MADCIIDDFDTHTTLEFLLTLTRCYYREQVGSDYIAFHW